MKILQINAIYGGGSTGRTAKELDEALKQAGHESFIAVSEPDPNNNNIYVIGNKLDHKIHSLLSRLFGLQGYFSFGATKRLIKYIDTIKPDIVHLRNLHANYVHVPLLLKYLAKKDIATVVTLHDCFFFTGKCTHYTTQGCYKWQSGCHNCPKLKADNKSWFFDRTKKLWNDKKKLFESIPRLAVVGVSDWITNEAKRSFLKSAKTIKTIYNWIDLSVFYPREAKTTEFTVLFISAGWTPDSQKFKDVLDLSELLKGKVRILLAGNVDSSIKLPKNITSLGYIKNTNDLAHLYSQIDVYVHLSTEDTFGKVVAEAMACGTPAIVYNSTALPELVANGCGYVVPAGDISQIHTAIIEIMKNGKEAFNSACLKNVTKNFSKEENINEYIELYENLCSINGDK